MLPHPALVKALEMLAVIFPRAPLPDSNFGSTFDDAFGDPKWAATARRDPAVQVAPRASVRAGVSTIKSCEDVLNKASDIGLPLLVLHAEGDTRTAPEGATELFEGASSQDKTLQLFPSAGHQLLQDQEEITKEVIDTIRTWLQNHT
eukprot:scaffold1248_cov393-Prasinococcus_capsulatus_cf.AAC.33